MMLDTWDCIQGVAIAWFLLWCYQKWSSSPVRWGLF